MEDNHKNEFLIFTKKFDTLEDVFKDEKFRSFLSSYMGSISMNRSVQPPVGFRYKRDGYDQLKESGRYTIDYVISQYPLIEQKKSELPGSVRKIIEGIVIGATVKMRDFYSIRVTEGLIFTGKNFTGRVEILAFDFPNKILKVECTTKTNEQFNTWPEDWDLQHTIWGFESGEYFAATFENYPPTKIQRV